MESSLEMQNKVDHLQREKEQLRQALQNLFDAINNEKIQAYGSLAWVEANAILNPQPVAAATKE